MAGADAWEVISVPCFGAEQSRGRVSGHSGCEETAPASPSPRPVTAQSSALKRASNHTENIRKPQQQLAWLKTTVHKATTWK